MAPGATPAEGHSEGIARGRVRRSVGAGHEGREAEDTYTISEYQRYYSENERKAYRDQAEFRELWHEFETPNELALQIVPHLRGKVDATKLPSSVLVTA